MEWYESQRGLWVSWFHRSWKFHQLLPRRYKKRGAGVFTKATLYVMIEEGGLDVYAELLIIMQNLTHTISCNLLKMKFRLRFERIVLTTNSYRKVLVSDLFQWKNHPRHPILGESERSGSLEWKADLYGVISLSKFKVEAYLPFTLLAVSYTQWAQSWG